MQRIIGVIAGILIPLSTLPVAAAAAEHARSADRPAAREQAAPRPEERAVVRERYAPRPAAREYYAPRAAVRERYAPRAAVREQYVPRAVVREHFEPHQVARPVVRERFMEPRYATRYEQRARFERRNHFVRYYSRNYFSNERVTQRVVFRRYVPRRIFLAPPVSYVYSGYMPVYGSRPAIMPVYYNAPVQLPLPLAWSPVTYESYYNGYNSYPYSGPYASYSQYPYANQYGYGFNAPPGMNPYGNAQLQGIVISNTGNGIIVMTPNLQPVFVNTAVAQQNGYVQGNISPGSFVNVFGYNTGNEFIATALG